MELYCLGNYIEQDEKRLYLGRESRMVWEGLFILKNPKDLLGSNMGDVGKIRR